MLAMFVSDPFAPQVDADEAVVPRRRAVPAVAAAESRQPPGLGREAAALRSERSVASSVLFGGVKLWKRFCLVTVLKNILRLVDICVFLSHVGKDFRVVVPRFESNY